ncbi:Nat5 [Kluyveromyces lactis]|nr:Nat5 [Kluyveromyces lactis]
MGRALVTIDNVYANNLGTFKKIIDVVLPVQYPGEYFEEVVDKNAKGVFYAQLAYYGEIAIGAVKSRLIANKTGGVKPAGMYIEVLAVLEAYRGKTAGSLMLKFIEDRCKESFQHDIYVHVATDNESAIEWYEKNGFSRDGDILEKYYKNTTGSNDAFVYKKSV